MGEKKKGGAKGVQKSGTAKMERSVKGGVPKQSVTMKQKLSGLKAWQLIVLLVVVVGGTVLFVGAASGWFGSSKVVLDAEYYCGDSCDGEMMELTGAEYEELIREGGSFVVFVDQSGCTTADRIREYMTDYALETGVRVYRMMFSEARDTSLHDHVKYYPSVVIVSRGRVVGCLRADSDEDADIYNDYDVFKEWMGRYLQIVEK